MPSPCPCRGCKAAYEQGYKEGADSVTLTVVNDMYKKGYTAGRAVGLADAQAETDRGVYNLGYRNGFNQAQAANRLLNEMYGVKQDANSVCD